MSDDTTTAIQPKVYRQFTLGTLREYLASLPADAPLAGLAPGLSSYRGFYEHVAIEPGHGTTAGQLLSTIEEELGGTMLGWGGGTYDIHEGCRVFVAQPGDTGPALVGFDGPAPVLVEETW